MDGLLEYKQQKEDAELKDMFQRYKYINSPDYWYDERFHNPVITFEGPLMGGRTVRVDPSGRGEYPISVSNSSKPDDLYQFGRGRDLYYRLPDTRYKGDFVFESAHTPPLDTMAFPEWFAQEQLKNRKRDHGYKGQYNDAVNFALDLESHKRDPYEVEAYDRESLPKWIDYYNKIGDEEQSRLHAKKLNSIHE